MTLLEPVIGHGLLVRRLARLELCDLIALGCRRRGLGAQLLELAQAHRGLAAAASEPVIGHGLLVRRLARLELCDLIALGCRRRGLGAQLLELAQAHRGLAATASEPVFVRPLPRRPSFRPRSGRRLDLGLAGTLSIGCLLRLERAQLCLPSDVVQVGVASALGDGRLEDGALAVRQLAVRGEGANIVTLLCPRDRLEQRDLRLGVVAELGTKLLEVGDLATLELLALQP